MQITLCEDDGIFFEGSPRNVILLVKFDDGKQIRVPYSAEKSIYAMYEDLNRIAPQALSKPLADWATDLSNIKKEKIDNIIEEVLSKPASTVSVGIPIIDKSNTIEKEDIVTLIKLESRGEGASCDLMVGHEYRVISIIQSGVVLPGSDNITQVIHGYDVVNDNGDRPERTRVFPHEVQLKRKRVPPPPIVRPKKEEILYCPQCASPNALTLDGSSFKGICVGCQNDISIERIIKKCRTDKCGNDVSLFDTGLTYKGTCNKCKSNIEVNHE